MGRAGVPDERAFQRQRYLIFDPTNQYVPIGEIPENEQGSYGLLVAGPDSQVIQLPMLRPDTDTTDRTAKFKLSPDRTLTGEVTELHSGASSWNLRENLSMASAKNQRKYLEQALQQSFSSFTLGTEKSDNAPARNRKPLGREVVRVRWVDATLSCSLLAGVWNSKVFSRR